MLYLANPCTPKVRDAMAAGHLGWMATPAQGNTWLPGVQWAADNGCFGSGYPGDAAWLSWLTEHPDRPQCVFATAPDVIGDAAATWRRSVPFLPAIRDLGIPAALVAQDGLTADDLDWSAFDALFIGGTTEFKLGAAARGIAAEALARGKWLHMGRVNSFRRLEYARYIGCDSIDGTYLTFGPDTNLPKLLGWLRQGETQGVLDFGVPS